MTVRYRSIWCATVIAGALSIVGDSMSYGQPPVPKEEGEKYYFANVSAFSINPQKGIETFRDYGGGGAGPGGTFGTGISRGKQRYEITLTGQRKANRFLATLTVKTTGGDESKTAENLSRELDLTDLQPQSIEIARDDDGQIYRVNIVPRITEIPAPRVFRVKDLEFDHWTFNGSTVILNDQDYAGTLSMSGGPLAWVDISGFAKVEFSLQEFKDARPEGILKDGTITITHDTTSLQINDVLNGANSEKLKNGPFILFVRWSAPSQTIEQARELMKLQMSKVQVDPDDVQMKGIFARIDKMLKSDRFFLLANGTGRIDKKDIIQP